jgi:hypothetical protein
VEGSGPGIILGTNPEIILQSIWKDWGKQRNI